MLPHHLLPHLKRVIVLSMFLSLVIGSAGNSLSPIIPLATGQSSPQNTDIFTGQFIPAYLGAAYDPSEAYRQMAGLPVYVYSYDTADKIVNNYIYKTQIRADGSFQAAGLPNASHYGVCLPVNDDGKIVFNGDAKSDSPFRPPITGEDGDGLESVFAFNIGLFPRTPEDTNPRNQLGEGVELSNINVGINPQPDEDHRGCRTFFTSNRTVDIANHVNIFPLVPTTVLSVLIYDDYATSGGDLANTNTPYEVYAQRVSLTITPQNDPQQQCDSPLNQASCATEAAINSIVSNGPIIRGRSVALRNAEGGTSGGTIFQAYAPRGVYAITFWRPDTRDAKSTLTYLSYTGSEPLNTTYNGIAFENVASLGSRVDVGQTEDNNPDMQSNQWKLYQRAMNVGADGIANSDYFWNPDPGNLNIWGMITAAGDGGSKPIGGQNISISDPHFGLIDFKTRKCVEGDASSGTVWDWGIYLFSTSCAPSYIAYSSTTTEISIWGGSNFLPIDNQSVTASGTQGPARRDFSLAAIGQGPVSYLYKNGKPISPTMFSIAIGGRVFRDVAKSMTGGKLIIPAAYLREARGQQIEVFATESEGLFGLSRSKTLAFTIDGTTLNYSNLAMANLGRVNLDANQTQVGRWLAQLNLSNFIDNFHIKPVLAVNDPQDIEMDQDDVKIFLDQGIINSISQNSWFTKDNYDLTKVEIVYPDDVAEIIGVDKNYVVFNRYGDGNDNKSGIITTADLADGESVPGTANPDYQTDASQSSTSAVSAATLAPNNGRIIGVRLKMKVEDMTDQLLDKDKNGGYEEYLENAKTSNGEMALELRIEFKRTNTAAPNSLNQETSYQTQSGQDTSQSYPSSLSATWPIIFRQDDAGVNHLQYDTVAVSIKAAKCPDSGGSFWGHGPDLNPSHLVCDAVSGMVSLVGRVTTFVADHLVTVDPLQYSITRDGWNIVRNLINGLAVLLLIVSGIAIMLRYEPQQFNLQSALTKLITTIVLINFSILIIQFGIDIANVMATGGYYFLINTFSTLNAVSSAGSMAATGMIGLAAAVFALTVAIPGPGWLAFILGLFIIFAGLLYVLLKALMFWIIRQVVLVICIIAAPVALAARVLPSTQPYYNKWKQLVVSTLLNQILFAFVLAIAIAILRAGATSSSIMLAIAQIGIAIGLFWYSTKFPAKAVSAFEGAAGVAVGSLASKGLSAFRQRAKNTALTRAERRILSERRDKELGVDKEGRELTLQNKLTRINSSTRPVLGSAPVKVFRKGFRKTLGRGTILAGTLGTKANASYSNTIRATDSKVPGTRWLPSPIKGVNLAYRSGIGLSLEDVENTEEKARKSYLQQVRAEIRRRNPQVTEQEIETELDKVRSDFDSRAFSAILNLDKSKAGDLNDYVSMRGGSWLTNDGTPGGSAVLTAGSMTAPAVFDSIFENVKNKDALNKFRTNLASAPNFVDMADYTAWRNGFTYDTRTGPNAWKKFFQDIGVPGDSLLGTGSIYGIANTLMLQKFGSKVDPSWWTDIRKNVSKLAGGETPDRAI